MKRVVSYKVFLNESEKPLTVQRFIQLYKGKQPDAKTMGPFLYDNWKEITGVEMGSMDFTEEEENFLADVIGYYHLDGEEVMKALHDYAVACNEKNDDEKIEEDFATIGTPPAGNVSGVGAVVPPTAGTVGSGDAWPSLGAPAVATPVNSAICPICKKSKKACKCADSPSEKKKSKLKKIKENLKYVSSFSNFLNEEGGELQVIDYKGEEITHSPHMPEFWFVNDETFDSLEDAKKYIDKGAKPSEKTIDAYRHGAM